MGFNPRQTALGRRHSPTGSVRAVYGRRSAKSSRPPIAPGAPRWIRREARSPAVVRCPGAPFLPARSMAGSTRTGRPRGRDRRWRAPPRRVPSAPTPTRVRAEARRRPAPEGGSNHTRSSMLGGEDPDPRSRASWLGPAPSRHPSARRACPDAGSARSWRLAPFDRGPLGAPVLATCTRTRPHRPGPRRTLDPSLVNRKRPR